MGTQPEAATYDATVYSYETTDAVEGGIGGTANAPLLNLANRTGWLKAQIAALVGAGYTTMAAVQQYAVGTYQPLLGFTPVTQGSGINMGANRIFIGYAVDGSAKVLLQVDGNEGSFGAIAFEQWVAANYETPADAQNRASAAQNNAYNAAVAYGNGTFVPLTGTTNLSGTFWGSQNLLTGPSGATNVNPCLNSFNGASLNSSGQIAAYQISGGSAASFGVTGASNIVNFYCSGNVVGAVYSNGGGGVSFATSSDHRLKQNVTKHTGALDQVAGVEAKSFQFKAVPDATVHGFIAHEVQAVVPQAVIGDKDAERTHTNAVLAVNGNVLADGVTEEEFKASMASDPSAYPDGATWSDSVTVPVHQMIDHSQLVPTLWAAVAELRDMVSRMETEIAGLRGAR